MATLDELVGKLSEEDKAILNEVERERRRVLVMRMYEEGIRSDDLCLRIGTTKTTEALSLINSNNFMGLVEKGINDQERIIRRGTIKTLTELAPINLDQFVELYKKGINDHDWRERYETARTLAALAPINPDLFVELYEEGIDDEDKNVRIGTIETLAALAPINPDLFVELYKKGITNEDKTVRRKTAEILAALASTISQEILIPIKDDEYKFFVAYLSSDYSLNSERDRKTKEQIQKEIMIIRNSEGVDYKKLKSILDAEKVKDLDEMLECGKVNVKNYKVIRKVASGGFKRVYEAVYHKEGFNPIVVALKIVDRKGTKDSSNVDELSQRFGLDGLTRGEVTSMQWLDHPNVAKLVDYGKTKDGEFYLSERFIRGLTLRKLFQSRERILEELRYELENVKKQKDSSNATSRKIDFVSEYVMEIIYKISEDTFKINKTIDVVTVEDGKLKTRKDVEPSCPQHRMIGAYLSLCKEIVLIMESLLNKHNLAHLDMKPENIIIDEFNGKLYITDMQTTRSLLPVVDNDKKGVHGSKNYACPSLLNGEDPEYESDIYSIGVMIYEAVTGRLPFGPYTSREEAKEDHNKNHNMKLEEALRLIGINIDKDSENAKEHSDNLNNEVLSKENQEYLRGILRKCLAYSPNDRYRDISQLKHDLEKVIDNMFYEKRVIVEGEEISPEDIRIINFLRNKYGANVLGSVVKSTSDIEVDEDYDFVMEDSPKTEDKVG